MNQKYLQRISSNMKDQDEAVFFEATPQNITAFLMQHRWAQSSAVLTVDDRPFLTARMGIIDICPVCLRSFFLFMLKHKWEVLCRRFIRFQRKQQL